MSLKDYVKNNNNLEQKAEEIYKNTSTKTQQEAHDFYNKYKNYSKDQLSEMLYKQVALDKANGTFNYNQIKSTINSLLPYLSSEQQKNMYELLERIK